METRAGIRRQAGKQSVEKPLPETEKRMEGKMKTEKVYRVHTHLIEQDQKDRMNWSTYAVIAKDAEEAIKLTKRKFAPSRLKEYITAVELMIELSQ